MQYVTTITVKPIVLIVCYVSYSSIQLIATDMGYQNLTWRPCIKNLKKTMK